MGIIIGLIIALIVIVVVVSAIQQHKAKLEQEKRAKVAKQKAVVDETEELILTLAHLPSNPTIMSILNKRSFNATKMMTQIMPESKAFKQKMGEYQERMIASQELAANQQRNEEQFILPDNEQQLLAILQCIKRLRIMLKSEQAKGALDAQTFTSEDKGLDQMQLTINIESLLKRSNMAESKGMLGSARQYLEKALQTLTDHPMQSEYSSNKRNEVEDKLHEITTALKTTNAQDAENKAKAESDELDLLFQPKKKW